jgi:hypothetical protein
MKELGLTCPRGKFDDAAADSVARSKCGRFGSSRTVMHSEAALKERASRMEQIVALACLFIIPNA